MTFGKKGQILKNKVKNNKVLHDHLYEGEPAYQGEVKKMPETITIESNFMEKFEQGMEVINEAKTLFQKLDQNNNKILEPEELINGGLEAIPMLLKLVSVIGALIGAIATVRSVLSKEFEWVLFLIAAFLFISFGIVTVIIKKTNHGAAETIKKLSVEFRTQMRDNNIKHIGHYDDLKKRFIDNKIESENKYNKLQNKHDGFKEQYYQLMAANASRGSIINWIQKQPAFKGVVLPEDPVLEKIPE